MGKPLYHFFVALFLMCSAMGSPNVPIEFFKVSESELPYYWDTIRSTNSLPRDQNGIVQYLKYEKLWDHPTLQAQWILETLLSNYALNGDTNLLVEAEAHLQRILSLRTEYQGAWFFPFSFDFELHGYETAMMKAPWYCALTQGNVLSVLVRMYRLDPKAEYLEVLEKVFASFKVGRSEDGPWVVTRDNEGYLWLEEYAPNQDFTFNGHIYAAVGLYDYWTLTDNMEAYALAQEAMESVLHYFESKMRTPNGWSRYCIAHGVSSLKYHRVHLKQMLELYTLTRNKVFAQMGDRLWLDYPEAERTVPFPVVLAPGVHVAHQFSSTGQIMGSRTLRVSSDIGLLTIKQEVLREVTGRTLLLMTNDLRYALDWGLVIERFGEELMLSWDGHLSGHALESTDDINGEWIALTMTTNVLTNIYAAPLSSQTRIFRLTDLSGYRLVEQYPNAYAKGFLSQRLSYEPLRVVQIEAGFIEAYLYRGTGDLTSKGNKSFTNAAAFELPFREQTIINGRRHVLIEAPGESLNGCWLPLGDRTKIL